MCAGFASAVLLVPMAQGSTSLVYVSAKITKTPVGYALTIKNAGDEPVKCFKFTLAPRVRATGIGTPPAGWQVGAPTPPPSPALVGKGEPGIPPGGTGVFPFRTDVTYPLDAGGTIAVSSDCKADFSFEVSGPSAPCMCDKLTVQIRGVDIVQATPTHLSIDLPITWDMECTGGAGKCTGELNVAPTVEDRRSGLRVKRLKGTSRTGKVSCKGSCQRGNGANVRFRISGGASFGSGKLGKSVRTISVEVDRFCERERAPLIFDIALGSDASGPYIDPKKSDLNGNGIADGKEKKR